MPTSAYLDEAIRWSKDLTRMRSKGPGDTENAMRAIEREYGVDYWTIWRLRYRRSAIKDVGVTTYMRLKAAYQAECQRQVRKLRNEIAIAEAGANAASTVVHEAKALADAMPGGGAEQCQMTSVPGGRASFLTTIPRQDR